MSTIAIASAPTAHGPRGSLGTLALGAIGVVYGDIGTRPLYALQDALEWAGGATPGCARHAVADLLDAADHHSVKYVVFVMRADNDGEGGILALMSLLGIKHGERVGVIAIGVLGAALLYGDGAITPAISVLGALEGINRRRPDRALHRADVATDPGRLVRPSVTGHARIGRLFGPIMVVWFVTIGLLGISGIVKHPGVLVALDPRYGLRLFVRQGLRAFSCWAAFPVRHRRRSALCRHGSLRSEADPIRLVRPVLPHSCSTTRAKPRLVDGAVATAQSILPALPGPLAVPLVALATAATIIASQAIISGAFSMTRQAIQLGCARACTSRRPHPTAMARSMSGS